MIKMDQMNLNDHEKELIKQEIQHKEAELYRMSYVVNLLYPTPYLKVTTIIFTLSDTSLN